MKNFQLSRPWEHQIYKTTKLAKPLMYCHLQPAHFSYPAIFETLENYDKTYWKLGDLIKFNSGYQEWLVKDKWQYWFTQNKDRQKFLKDNCRREEKIPHYAANQYAIILARYKWTRYKHQGTYKDYGSIIMMLTGEKIGHIRRYYMLKPYKKIGTYPYTKLKYRLIRKKLFCDIEIGNDIKNFLKNLTEKIAYESH